VQIDGAAVLQRRGLLLHPPYYLGMTVAAGDSGDPGEQVEIPPAGLVEEVLHLALDDHQRVAVQGEDGGMDVAVAERQHLLA
jgi:hypothetical protein